MTKTSPTNVPIIPPLAENDLAADFPGGFTIRDEANALTAYAFRNGPLEELHAGKSSSLLDDPSLSRLTDAEMKHLMINASEKLAQLLALRDTEPEHYRQFVQSFGWRYCRFWNR